MFIADRFHSAPLSRYTAVRCSTVWLLLSSLLIRRTLIVTCVAVVSCRVLACREDHSVSPSPAQPKTKPFVSKLPSPKTYTSRLEMFEFCTACNNYVLYLTCLSVSYQRGRWFVFQCDEIPVSQQKPAGANNSGRREKVNT